MPGEETMTPEQAALGKLPFDPKTILEHKFGIAFNCRGNDIYWQMCNFLLTQCNIFKYLSIYTSISMWGPGAEQLFDMICSSPIDGVMLLDSDVAPTIETPVRLIERDKDIVSCPTWMCDGGNTKTPIHLNVHYNGNFKRVTIPRSGGLEEISNTSWACVYIKKRVLEMFKQANETFTKWSPMLSEDLQNLPPDSMFFEKCKAFGFQVWMDWDCEFATHHKYVPLNSNTLETFLMQRIYELDDHENLNRAWRILSRRQDPVPA